MLSYGPHDSQNEYIIYAIREKYSLSLRCIEVVKSMHGKALPTIVSQFPTPNSTPSTPFIVMKPEIHFMVVIVLTIAQEDKVRT